MIISRRSILGTAAAEVVTAAIANSQTSDIPLPERPAIDIGPRDVIRDLENPDVLVPPATDSGTLPNLKFSFADA
jgi:oxalate decarboxylase